MAVERKRESGTMARLIDIATARRAVTRLVSNEIKVLKSLWEVIKKRKRGKRH